MEVLEGLEWKHIYWVRGHVPKGMQYRNAVSDPPCAGWQHAFVLVGEKLSTIFCPYSLSAYTVRNDFAEISLATEPRTEFDLESIVALMKRKWEEFQGFGFQKDYDTCALVLRKLGQEVPAQVLTGGGEDTRKKGGKPVEAALKKAVKAVSKRGKFLKWFLDNDNSRSIREAMAVFSMSRSNALSYLHMIHKDHGIGYELVGDMATVMLPEGCTDPFNMEPTAVKTEDENDDSWLD